MIGPALPPQLSKSKIESNSETKKEASPNSVSQKQSVSTEHDKPTSRNPPSASAPKRTLGPQLPPGFERPEHKPPQKDLSPEESDDEMIGPLPPSHSDVKTSALDSKLAEICNRAHPEKSDEKVTRGDWMTILPESRAGDPLKTIARQFKRTNAPEKDADRSLWTETPEQRSERLRGHKPVPVSEKSESFSNKRSLEQEELISSTINEFNQFNRPKSLMEIHQESLTKKRVKKGTQDDPAHPSNNRFDRERDMSIKTLDPKKQHELLKKAGSLSDRFARGAHSKFE